MLMLDRRRFGAALAGAGALTLGGAKLMAAPADETLKPITGDAVPITPAERLARIEQAQARMRAHGIGAILVEPGASLDYVTGVQWWRSERLTALVLPAEGEPAIVTPFFEEPSVRESLGVPAEIRVWQ